MKTLLLLLICNASIAQTIIDQGDEHLRDGTKTTALFTDPDVKLDHIEVMHMDLTFLVSFQIAGDSCVTDQLVVCPPRTKQDIDTGVLAKSTVWRIEREHTLRAVRLQSGHGDMFVAWKVIKSEPAQLSSGSK